jgi:hypothetical protein
MLGSEVVDLVKDPNVAGPLTRSTTQKSKLDRALTLYDLLLRVIINFVFLSDGVRVSGV